MSYNTQDSKYSDVILLKKAKSKWTNIFPAPVIKQTLPHKHNKHRKTSFLSAIQATPSHCWKRVKSNEMWRWPERRISGQCGWLSAVGQGTRTAGITSTTAEKDRCCPKAWRQADSLLLSLLKRCNRSAKKTHTVIKHPQHKISLYF